MNGITRTIIGITATAGVAVGAAVLAAPAQATGTPGCVTRTEYRHVHNGMTATEVARIYGTSGHLSLASGSGQFRMTIRDYKTCTAFHVTNVSFMGGRVSGKLYI